MFVKLSEIKLYALQFIPHFLPVGSEERRCFDRIVERYPSIKILLLLKIYSIVGTHEGRVKKLPLLLHAIDVSISEAEARMHLMPFEVLNPPKVGMNLQIQCEEIWDYPVSSEDNEWYQPGLYEACLPYRAFRTSFSFTEKLGQLGIPTLLFSGKFDPFIPSEAMEEMAHASRTVLWQDSQAGHGLIRENSSCSMRLIELFTASADVDALVREINTPACRSLPASN